MIPQLKVRSEFSFKHAYGRVPLIVKRLKELDCRAAGMVEVGGGTWGHVQWEQQLTSAGIQPMFGAELVIRRGDEDRPTCWVLAEDTKALYQLTTKAFEQKFWGAAVVTEEQLAATRGLIRFAGAATEAKEAIDYVDLNPASALQRRRAIGLAKRLGRPLVLTSDNAYPAPADADVYRLFGRVVKPSPQHLLSDEEFLSIFRDVPPDLLKAAVASTHEVAERLKGVKLAKAPMIHFEGDLRALCEEGRRKRNMEWNDVYQARLERELSLIAEKNFGSYFLIVSDLIRWAKDRMLVGPGRGSSAGSLVCYLTFITEIDPLKYGLIFERFVDVNRGGAKFDPKFEKALDEVLAS